MRLRLCAAIAAIALLVSATTADAQIRITEWAYQGAGGEFFELSNVGSSGVDLSGWSYTDEVDSPGAFDLSAFGVVAPGESVVVAEATEAAFRTDWGLDASVKVIGELGVNLGRNDEINIYDALDALVDRLDFGDQDFPGSIRTRADFEGEGSGNPGSNAALGADNPLLWVSSSIGDRYGSHMSTSGDVGNPGVNVVPEPVSLALMLLGVPGLVIGRRTR